MQLAARAAEKEPAAHGAAAKLLVHAEPAGQGTELFEACAGHRMPGEHGKQLDAVRPPAEKEPGVQGLGAAPPPAHAQPGGHGCTLAEDVDGQKIPAAHDVCSAPLPAQK